MPDPSAYRAYEISNDGHVVSREDLSCLDEEVAKERTRALAQVGG